MKTIKLTPKYLNKVMPFTGHHLHIWFADFMGEYDIPNDRVTFLSHRMESILSESQMQMILDRLINSGEPCVANCGVDPRELNYEKNGGYELSHWYFFNGDAKEWDKRNADQLSRYLNIFADECENAFINAGGDDSTFDYIPAFIELFENLLELLGLTQKTEDFRKELYRLDPEYPEFFSDEEIAKFSKSK